MRHPSEHPLVRAKRGAEVARSVLRLANLGARCAVLSLQLRTTPTSAMDATGAPLAASSPVRPSGGGRRNPKVGLGKARALQANSAGAPVVSADRLTENALDADFLRLALQTKRMQLQALLVAGAGFEPRALRV
jgi:hypothetical protein